MRGRGDPGLNSYILLSKEMSMISYCNRVKSGLLAKEREGVHWRAAAGGGHCGCNSPNRVRCGLAKRKSGKER